MCVFKRCKFYLCEYCRQGYKYVFVINGWRYILLECIFFFEWRLVLSQFYYYSLVFVYVYQVYMLKIFRKKNWLRMVF